MESLLLHDYFPHTAGAALLVGLFLIIKCVKKTCVAICFLSGWMAAGIMIFLARHHWLETMVDPTAAAADAS